MNIFSVEDHTLYIRRGFVVLIIASLVATAICYKMTPSNAVPDQAQKENGPRNAAPVKEPAKPKVATVAASSQLSGAEVKAQKKAEKAARRQQGLQQRDAGPSQGGGKADTQSPSQGGKANPKGSQDGGKVLHNRTGSMASETKVMAVRGPRPNTSKPSEPQAEDKTVELFRHLYKTRATTIAGVGKDVHPAVLALGQQMRSYTICGSNARLVATLQAFKRVIESYSRPTDHALNRHLSQHVLSPQIEYLTSCRPLSVSMGTAIRWLKLKIAKVDKDEPDAAAKSSLCEAIDEYIRDRVTLADQVIAKSAVEKCIKDGDVILTFAKSSIVQQTLSQAHKEGRKFQVIVADSRPLFEGKSLARALAGIGVEVKYCLINGLSHCVQDATKVLLGAHAMMSNGALYSRVGTSLVAMEAHSFDIPVIVLCESIKCTDKVALDSIVMNEVAPPDELLLQSTAVEKKSGTLDGWRDTRNLQLLNFMYDVTPADYIAMIVTELGIVPPSSVPVLQRLANEAE